MKNFWLERRGPKKAKINIWLGASITGSEEEFFGTINAATGEQHDRLLVELNVDDHGTETVMYSTNAKLSIPHEIDQMLWDLRIGKGLVARFEQGLFNGKEISRDFMKSQWIIPEGCRMWKQGSYQKITNNNGNPEDDRYTLETTFYIKEEKPDLRTQGSCPTVLSSSKMEK